MPNNTVPWAVQNGWPFAIWVVDSDGPNEAQFQSYSPGFANVPSWEGTLVPPGNYDWTVCLQWCVALYQITLTTFCFLKIILFEFVNWMHCVCCSDVRKNIQYIKIHSSGKRANLDNSEKLPWKRFWVVVCDLCQVLKCMFLCAISTKISPACLLYVFCMKSITES